MTIVIGLENNECSSQTFPQCCSTVEISLAMLDYSIRGHLVKDTAATRGGSDCQVTVGLNKISLGRQDDRMQHLTCTEGTQDHQQTTKVITQALSGHLGQPKDTSVTRQSLGVACSVTAGGPERHLGRWQGHLCWGEVYFSSSRVNL